MRKASKTALIRTIAPHVRGKPAEGKIAATPQCRLVRGRPTEQFHFPGSDPNTGIVYQYRRAIRSGTQLQPMDSCAVTSEDRSTVSVGLHQKDTLVVTVQRLITISELPGKCMIRLNHPKHNTIVNIPWSRINPSIKRHHHEYSSALWL